MGNKYVEHNGSGYVDPTVDEVIKHEYDNRERANEDYKYCNMMRKIKKILDSNNYVLNEPISLTSMKSGRKRRIY